MFILFFLFISFEVSALQTHYWSVEDFFKQYSYQYNLYTKFSKIVRTTGKKIAIKQTKPVKITIIYPGEQVSDYWRRSKDAFIKRLNELKIWYEIDNYFTKPAIETDKQIQLIYQSVSQETDYLIFTLDVNIHRKLIEQILIRKKPKIILQNITTPLKEWGHHQPFLYVGFDHSTGTKMLADFYSKQFQTAAKYAVLYGSQGYVSHMRGDNFIVFMKNSPHIQLVAKYYTNFNQENAKQATLEILQQYPDIDFIYACSTDIAMGAIQALKETNKKVMLNGWGGGALELQALAQGWLAATIMRINDDNGVAMAEAIRLDIENKAVPTIYSGQMVLLTTDTSKSKIYRLEKEAFRYSGIPK